MRKKIYNDRRLALINAAQAALDEGKLDEYKKAMEDIEALDREFEAQAEAQANLNALTGARASAASELVGSAAIGGDDLEYRRAFMNYVTKGTPITNVTTTTSDVSPVIPTTVLDRIVERMESIGDVLNLVTRTSYKGGLTIPTSTVKPTASWVAEGAGSTVQKNGVNGTITFAYHKLRIAVSMTLEVETMSLSAFEAKFIRDVADGMTRALEQAIISGDGSGKPKGILAETPASGQALEIAANADPDYGTLVEMEAALPKEYENGARWAMTKKTFMLFVGMTDDNGQPIAKVNYGIAGRPERFILGRPVEILDPYMSNYTSTVTADTIVAFIFDFADYTLNTNLDVTVSTYEDHTNEDKVRKAVMLVDGKVVDKNSLVTLTKKAA